MLLKKVRSISANIEAIKSDYVELKEKFIKREESTNIAIILKPNIKGVKGYKQISLTIDGVSIMNFINDGTMWTPTKEMTIFNSYLPYGEHKYVVTTKLMIDQHNKGKITPLYTKEFKHSGTFNLNSSTKKTVIPLELRL